MSPHSDTHAIQSGSDGCGMGLAELAPLRAPLAHALFTYRTRFSPRLVGVTARITTVYSTVATSCTTDWIVSETCFKLGAAHGEPRLGFLLWSIVNTLIREPLRLSLPRRLDYIT
jgi:hypothetical protein